MQVLQTRLRQRARALGLSDAEVARRAGLTERRYGHYVTGEREPNLVTLIKIGAVLALTPNELLLPDHGEMSGSLRSLLEARISAALNALDDDDLKLAASQLECLVMHRTGRS